MRRAALLVGCSIVTAALFSAIARAVYGSHAFVQTFEILAPLGVVTTLLADVIAAHRGLLRRRLGAIAVLAAVQLGAGVALFAGLMFVSSHDAFFTALLAAYAALIGLLGARLVARSALHDLEEIRAALRGVAQGARRVEIRLTGGGELAALASDIEATVAKLAAEERARRELVASVSHDLRTPVTTLRLIAEGLEDEIFEPERTREQLGLMTTHVRALGALIDDLFELSRLEAGELAWTMGQVRLDELVRETVEAMRPQADAGRVMVRAELDHALSPTRGNPEQLQRVLFNLIQNAIRHTPADGSVVVRATDVSGRAVEVEVADSGEGIERSERERIFEPFVQGSTRANGGAGLGLAIARAIVEAHGGRIWLGDGQSGTQIRFSLPAA
jgi:signal transduction histidine kinase